ncbi:hypothetical protein J6590_018976, partial [Homalodisca vitripennis]
SEVPGAASVTASCHSQFCTMVLTRHIPTPVRLWWPYRVYCGGAAPSVTNVPHICIESNNDRILSAVMFL